MHLPGLADLTPLGQGGFATVYRARQVQLNREVAVKIDNRVLRTERDRRRFLREAHAAARLSGHPHVVSVHDANFTPQGTPYLVMELCTGGSLADVVRREGPLGADRVRQLGVQLADALAAAHAEGVLHRDIKPGNILLDRYGTAKLADFGLAALLDAEGSSTVTRDALSPSYAPPEAFAMAQPTPAADVYALAATLYDLLAGKPPRPVPWPVESFDHLGEVLRSPVPRVPGVPQDLHDTLVRALHPDLASPHAQRVAVGAGVERGLGQPASAACRAAVQGSGGPVLQQSRASAVRCPAVRCFGVRCPVVRCSVVRCPAVRASAVRCPGSRSCPWSGPEAWSHRRPPSPVQRLLHAPAHQEAVGAGDRRGGAGHGRRGRHLVVGDAQPGRHDPLDIDHRRAGHAVAPPGWRTATRATASPNPPATTASTTRADNGDRTTCRRLLGRALLGGVRAVAGCPARSPRSAATTC